MRITQKGQVTIPEEIRKKYGFLPYAEVDFVEKKGEVFIKLLSKKKTGPKVVALLRGTATIKMTTDEILALTRGKK